MSLIGRAVDYLTFYASVTACLLRLLAAGDVVVAKTDPPLISVVAAACAALKGARLIAWMQDVFPEVAERLKVALPRPVMRCLAFLRDWSLHRALVTVALGERMQQHLVSACGVSPDRISVIHNWADSETIRPMSGASSPFRKEWRLENRFVVAYSGNMGRAHEFETIVQAMIELQGEREVLFLFIGDGNKAEWLRSQVEQHGLRETVSFLPYADRARLSESLGAADVHLVSLKPDLEGLIVPSKFYAIAAAGKPAIFIGDLNGEIAAILARYGCGYSVAVGDGTALTDRIRSLRSSPDERARLGGAAREALVSHFDRGVAFERWQKAVERAASKSAI
jgi:glycosyltransferase involved in cell wall biosynthesis